jgi:molecular chaperone GrpE
MADPKGPKIDLPEELVEELEHSAEAEAPTSPGFDLAEGGSNAEPAPTGDDVGLEAKLDDARDKYLRLAADFENYKRRVLREREELFHYANENLIKELLDTVDNLERALEHAQQSAQEGESKTLLEGVELTHRSLMQALEKSGVEVVAPEGGSEFDPSVHEAIRQVQSDAHPAGTIVEVLQKGYVLRERLLRPALVVVSSGS